MIAPGSQFTLAQLGIPESYTPPATRLRTRMFPAPDGVSWEPYKVRTIKKEKGTTDLNGDTAMGENGQTQNDAVEEDEYEEDLESDEGAVYPLTEGRITNMPAFLALLNHVHNILSPTLHTPILLVAQPAWTAQDQESITQFIFEKFKTPAFCLMDSGLCAAYGAGLENALVIDVGYQKADVTAIVESCVQTVGRTIALPGAGDAMTDKLLELLGKKGWNKDMCEQLKKSTFCEILPLGTPLPGSDGAKEDTNPAAAASTGAAASGPSVKIADVPRGPGPETDVGDEEDGEGRVDDDGVLDVASIVTSGKTQEFLAAQERKKAAAAGRKAAKDAREAAEAAAAKPVRLPNSQREKVVFHYQEKRSMEEKESIATESKPADATADAAPNAEMAQTEGAPADGEAVNADASAAPDNSIPVEDQKAKNEQVKAAKREEKRKAKAGEGGSVRREMEVGTERFLAASGGLIENLADAIHRTVLAVPEVEKRAAVWDNVLLVGHGMKVRGFREALMNTLTSKYIISPSSATIFTSELPSNLSTPIGTGSQTPTREYPIGQHPLPTSSGVNPLLIAATTAGNPAMSQMGGYSNGISHAHTGHGQSPTSIKLAKVPECFPNFKVCLHAYIILMHMLTLL